MACRVLATLSRPTGALLRPTSQLAIPRSFHTSQRLLQDGIVARKPVGAFRGTLFGFLLGATLAGSGLYYYVIDEYKVSNELLSEDIYALQSAVQRIETYVKSLEDEIKTKK
nr:hypothetical protein CFP56_63753 [Quercus suber]